jgi:hypothetical protein
MRSCWVVIREDVRGGCTENCFEESAAEVVATTRKMELLYSAVTAGRVKLKRNLERRNYEPLKEKRE